MHNKLQITKIAAVDCERCLAGRYEAMFIGHVASIEVQLW